MCFWRFPFFFLSPFRLWHTPFFCSFYSAWVSSVHLFSVYGTLFARIFYCLSVPSPFRLCAAVLLCPFPCPAVGFALAPVAACVMLAPSCCPMSRSSGSCPFGFLPLFAACRFPSFFSTSSPVRARGSSRWLLVCLFSPVLRPPGRRSYVRCTVPSAALLSHRPFVLRPRGFPLAPPTISAPILRWRG